MKTILVLAPHPELAEAVRAALNPEQYHVLHRANLEEAEPLLKPGLIDVCVLDVELVQVQALWLIEKVRSRTPKCPLLVYTGSKPCDWEEDAYLLGVTHVLNKPLRSRLLNALLERFLAPSAPAPAPPALRSTASRSREVQAPRPLSDTSHTHRALQVLRDFSGILTHSLQADGLLKQFLLLLREILAV